MEVREAASAESLKPSHDGNRESQVALYYFGDAFSSPFDISLMSLSQTDHGILVP